MIKRLFDIIVACIGLFFMFPLALFVAFLIKIDDGGPVLYLGMRVGKNGVPFSMYKFRTMLPAAESLGGYSTADKDPRITSCGRILRLYKFDEIPQLLNVLKGEMSIVGPRPEVPYYAKMFTASESRILSVKPGLTDWASLWNFNEGEVLSGYADPEKAYTEKIRPRKIALQLQYVREQSFATDCRILIVTMARLLRCPISIPEKP